MSARMTPSWAVPQAGSEHPRLFLPSHMTSWAVAMLICIDLYRWARPYLIVLYIYILCNYTDACNFAYTTAIATVIAAAAATAVAVVTSTVTTPVCGKETAQCIYSASCTRVAFPK